LQKLVGLRKSAARFASSVFVASDLFLWLEGRSPLVNRESVLNMRVLLAHPGTQYSSQLARQLYRRDCLHRFWTSFALVQGGFIDRSIRRLMSSPPKWLDHRVVPEVPRDKLRTIPLLEVDAVLRMRFGAEPQIVMHRRNEKFQRAIAQADIEQSDIVIGFDTSSEILAKRAQSVGRDLILDQTIAHPKSKGRVYEQIRKQFPDWSNDLEVRDVTIGAAEDVEHQIAKAIVVASSFTKSTLVENGISPDKIMLNPYGVDLQRFSIQHRSQRDRPFRFLFAGLVCARKGIPLLLQAWSALNPVEAELWIAGPITPVAASRISSKGNVKILGKVPNPELAKVMADSDVFVLPSYFEGFGLVLLEAMAAGLPVLTTTATAGPDILSEDIDGFVIEPGDLDALVSRIKFCLANRDQIISMGASARQTAERFSWDAYGERWQQILEKVV
jgi:glycosyltransferase involved in cell wall biosynthesis